MPAALSCALQDNASSLESVQVKLETTVLNLGAIDVCDYVHKNAKKFEDNGMKWHGIALKTVSRRGDKDTAVQKKL